MPYIDPFQIPRPERPVTVRTFDTDGYPVTLAFRTPDAADLNRAHEKKDRLIKDFITGYPEDGTPPADFFDGIKVSAAFFEMCATAEEMQPPKEQMPEGSQWFDAVQLVVLMDRLPNDGPQIARFINEMIVGWRRAPNSLGAPTGSASAERSNPTPSTSSPLSVKTSSSGSSTSASEPSAATSPPPIPALISSP